jgi:hypothetical protein
MTPEMVGIYRHMEGTGRGEGLYVITCKTRHSNVLRAKGSGFGTDCHLGFQ